MEKNGIVISQYFKDNSNRLAETTIDGFKITLPQFFNFCNLEFDQVKSSDIRAWITKLKESGRAATTINNKLKHLRAFYKYCLEERLVAKSPLELILPLKEKERLPVYLSKEQLLELREASKSCPRDRAIIETLYTTGVRVRELVSIRLVDINWGQRKIWIHKGKGKQERFVLFTAECGEWIKAYLNKREHVSDYLFLSQQKGSPLSLNGVRGILQVYSDRLKWRYRLTPHMLRHTFAAHLAQKGMPLSYIQELLGHTVIESTKAYTKLKAEAQKMLYDNYL